jgi:uncharacterized protein
MTTFNLRTVKLKSGEQFRTELPVHLEPFELGGEHYRPEPASPGAQLTITRAGSGTVFELSFATRLQGVCMRCLGEAAFLASVDAREYHERDAELEELRTPYVAEDRLDLSAWARDALALTLPEKILCREDCAGLCAGCGANLNIERCRCGPPPPDERWGKLAELKERLET